MRKIWKEIRLTLIQLDEDRRDIERMMDDETYEKYKKDPIARVKVVIRVIKDWIVFTRKYRKEKKNERKQH